MNPTMTVSGFTETVENLRAYSRQMQQNIERKAMRQTMNQMRKWQKIAWKNYPVEKSSLEWGKGKIKTYKSGRQKRVRSYSIRKESSKAVTVKVGTKRRGEGYIVYGRVFLSYSKKNAKSAKMAHFLEMDREGHKGKYRIRNLYENSWRKLFRTFAKALDIYIALPGAKSSSVREQL
jgi:hypothetical protein